MTIKPCGDYCATGQDEWRCEYCEQTEYHCDCDDELELAPVVRISPTQVGI